MKIKTPAKTVFFYLRLCFSCVLVIYLIHLIDFERFKFAVAKLQIKFVYPAFFLVLIASFAAAARWSLVLSRFAIQQRVKDSWRYYLVSGFYGTVLPGIIGEDVIRLGLSLKAHGRSKALIATSILFERTCGIVVILMMAAAAALYVVPVLMQGERFLSNLIVVAAICALSVFFLFFLILKVSPSSWFKNEHAIGKLRQKAISLLGRLRGLSFGAVSVFLLLSMLAHLCDITGTFFLSRSLHIDQSYTIFLLIIPLVYVLTMLPISVGGIGVREGVLTFFLVKVGVPASDAVLLGFIIYLNRVAVGLIGGVVQFAGNRSLSLEKSDTKRVPQIEQA